MDVSKYMGWVMPNCKDVHRLVAAGLDRELPFADRVRVRVHLAMCKGCANFSRHMYWLRAAMRRFPGLDNE
jgi:predicted anti-sigma-YlaC factor YlaD